MYSIRRCLITRRTIILFSLSALGNQGIQRMKYTRGERSSTLEITTKRKERKILRRINRAKKRNEKNNQENRYRSAQRRPIWEHMYADKKKEREKDKENRAAARSNQNGKPSLRILPVVTVVGAVAWDFEFCKLFLGAPCKKIPTKF